MGIRLGTKLILAFADDLVFIAENKEDHEHLAEILVEETGYVGLIINKCKTKYLRANRRRAGCDQNEPLKVNEFILN